MRWCALSLRHLRILSGDSSSKLRDLPPTYLLPKRRPCCSFGGTHNTSISSRLWPAISPRTMFEDRFEAFGFGSPLMTLIGRLMTLLRSLTTFDGPITTFRGRCGG